MIDRRDPDHRRSGSLARRYAEGVGTAKDAAERMAERLVLAGGAGRNKDRRRSACLLGSHRISKRLHVPAVVKVFGCEARRAHSGDQKGIRCRRACYHRCLMATNEIPNVPHMNLETMGHFALAKVREAVLAAPVDDGACPGQPSERSAQLHRHIDSGHVSLGHRVISDQAI